MIYANRPLFLGPTGWLGGSINTANNTVTTDNGLVLSVQPNGGMYETRPPGTAGVYEQHRKSGDKLVYEPVPGEFYVIPIVE